MHAAVAATRDADIAELLRAGQRDRAFAVVLARYEGKVLRLCCAMLRDRSEAEDAAQESVVRIWKTLDRYDGRASLSSWIYAITRNRCLTMLERRRSRQALSGGEIDTSAEELEMGDEASDTRAEQLREVVGLLPERLRQALLLYYYEQRSISEVALMLGCPEGTVKTHLFRARAALTQQLQQRGLDDPSYWFGE